MADWSQLFSVGAIGAVAGGALTWLGGMLKTGFEHLLDQRRKRAEEERSIRAEEREAARKRAERTRAEAERLKQDEAVLSMYKTQLKGAMDLPTAGSIVGGIHSYFVQRPQYLNAINTAFLEKYPNDFREHVCFSPQNYPPTALEDLKRAVDAVSITVATAADSRSRTA